MAAKRKYEKYFLNDVLIKGDGDVPWRIRCQGSTTGLGGLMKNYWLRWNCVTKPRTMLEPHSHEFDEIFHFFGADPFDISDFQATVEFHMGKEDEVYKITKPTIVYIPAGLVHAPIDITIVKKPIVFMNVANAIGYVTMVDGKEVVFDEVKNAQANG